MRYKPLALVVLLAMLVPAMANATVVIARDFKSIATDATAILVGRVTALNSQWATDRQGIDTFISVAVTRYLKGNMGPQVVFRVAGGQIGYLRSVRVGAPAFREGDEVVLFLSDDGVAIPRIVGFNQGVYRVTTDRATGMRMVASPVLMGDVTTATPIVRGDPSRKPMPLAQFEDQVRSVLQRAAADRQDRGARQNDRRKR